MREARRTRGVKNLVEYLGEEGCPMSEATIYRLIRVGKIPFRRPSPQVLIFDLNAIDDWLSPEYEEVVN